MAVGSSPKNDPAAFTLVGGTCPIPIPSDLRVHNNLGVKSEPAAKFEFLDAPQKPGEIGRLGPYRITRLIGRGGMGYVFAAVDSRLRRPVAVKLMRGRVAKTPDARRRFVEEARSMAAVSDDNVATIFEVNVHRGMPLMAMELLEGDSLETVAKRKTFTADEVLQLARETASGLNAAAARGIVHRDIKPGNLWVTPSGRIKILDFGLAVAGGSPLAPTDAESTSGQSTSGQTHNIVGSPGYLSPEQSRNDPLDGRTDLYSLGVVMYQLLAGRLPIIADSMLGQLIAVQCYAPVPLAEAAPSVPRPVADLVDGLLTKEPGDRIPTATEFIRAIDRVKRQLRDEAEAPLNIVTQPANPDTPPVAKRSGIDPTTQTQSRQTKRRQTVSAVPDADRPTGPAARFSTGWRLYAAVATSAMTIALIAWWFSGPRRRSAAAADISGRSAGRDVDYNADRDVDYNAGRDVDYNAGHGGGGNASVVAQSSPMNVRRDANRSDRAAAVEIDDLRPIRLIPPDAWPTVRPGSGVAFDLTLDGADLRTNLRRKYARHKTVAQLVVLDGDSDRRLAPPRRLGPRQLPAAGSTLAVSMQWIVDDQTDGPMNIEIHLQTLDGQTTKKITAELPFEPSPDQTSDE